MFCYCCCKKQLRKLRRDVKAVRFMLSRPGRMGFRLISEENGMAKFVMTLPGPATAADWVSRELSVTVAGAEPIVAPVEPKENAESTEFVGFMGDVCHAELVDIDDDGNRSTPPSVLDFTLTDTMPPATPGMMGVRITEE